MLKAISVEGILPFRLNMKVWRGSEYIYIYIFAVIRGVS
jgi:hypothetical protein